MKSISGTVVAVAAAVVVLGASLAGGRLGVSPADSQAPVGSISVSGSSAIRVQPDRVVVVFGVETFSETPRASQEKNAVAGRQVLAAIRALGVAEKDIATAAFTIQPEYNGYAPRREIIGYWTRNTIGVTLRDVALLEPVLVAALESGATAVDEVEFSVTNLRALRDQARAQAVQAALEKASAMAGAAQMAVGNATSIHENSWYSGYYGGNRQWTNYQNVVQDLSAAGAITLEDGSIALGQIVVRAEVSLSATLVPAP